MPRRTLQTFASHLMLAFSHDDKPAYPRTLQAQVEYPDAVQDDSGHLPIAPVRPPFETVICISNSATSLRTRKRLTFTASLINEAGRGR